MCRYLVFSDSALLQINKIAVGSPVLGISDEFFFYLFISNRDITKRTKLTRRQIITEK
jgi:hypothetical protein